MTYNGGIVPTLRRHGPLLLLGLGLRVLLWPHTDSLVNRPEFGNAMTSYAYRIATLSALCRG